MNVVDIITVAVIVLIVALAAIYVIKAKKKGKKCIGCPEGGHCDGCCSGNEVAAAMVGMTKAAALAYLMFNLFTPPCFAALGAMNAEIKQKKWFWGGIALQLAAGYTVSFLVYQIGTLIETGSVGAGFLGGLIAVAVIVSAIVYLCVSSKQKIKTEYALSGKK